MKARLLTWRNGQNFRIETSDERAYLFIAGSTAPLEDREIRITDPHRWSDEDWRRVIAPLKTERFTRWNAAACGQVLTRSESDYRAQYEWVAVDDMWFETLKKHIGGAP